MVWVNSVYFFIKAKLNSCCFAFNIYITIKVHGVIAVCGYSDSR